MGEVPMMRVVPAEAFEALAERVDRLEAAASKPPLTVTITTDGGNLVSVGATGVQAKARRVEVKSRHGVHSRGMIWIVGTDPTLVPGILVTDGETVAEVTGVEAHGSGQLRLILKVSGKPEAPQPTQDAFHRSLVEMQVENWTSPNADVTDLQRAQAQVLVERARREALERQVAELRAAKALTAPATPLRRRGLDPQRLPERHRHRHRGQAARGRGRPDPVHGPA